MTKYRRKPLVLDAVQFFADWENGPIDHLPAGMDGDYRDRFPMDAYWWVNTLEGQMTVNEGDWILTGVNGEHWVVRDDIFKETYEPVCLWPVEACEC